jgi:hypothetical protein
VGVQHVSLSTEVHIVPAHSVSSAVGSAIVPSGQVIDEHCASSLQHKSLSAPELSHIAPAQSVSVAVESKIVPSAQMIVEHGAFSLQHASIIVCSSFVSGLSLLEASITGIYPSLQMIPGHVCLQHAILSSSTLMSHTDPVHSDVEADMLARKPIPQSSSFTATTPLPSPSASPHVALLLQHKALSSPVLSHVSPTQSVAAAVESDIVPSAQVIVEQDARGSQHNSLSAPVLSHSSPAHNAARSAGSDFSTCVSAQVIDEHVAIQLASVVVVPTTYSVPGKQESTATVQSVQVPSSVALNVLSEQGSHLESVVVVPAMYSVPAKQELGATVQLIHG